MGYAISLDESRGPGLMVGPPGALREPIHAFLYSAKIRPLRAPGEQSCSLRQLSLAPSSRTSCPKRVCKYLLLLCLPFFGGRVGETRKGFDDRIESGNFCIIRPRPELLKKSTEKKPKKNTHRGFVRIYLKSWITWGEKNYLPPPSREVDKCQRRKTDSVVPHDHKTVVFERRMYGI